MQFSEEKREAAREGTKLKRLATVEVRYLELDMEIVLILFLPARTARTQFGCLQ